ncbi:MAG: IS4 family transposase [Thermosynechococcaceae cyanobacterium]
MIAEEFQIELKNQLTKTEYLLLSLIIVALQIVKKVKLETLSESLPMPILLESRRKKLQRFLDLGKLSLEKLWLPCFKKLIEQSLEYGQTVYIAIDRTNWGCINILMVSLIWERRAWPIYWVLLEKAGNSNLEDQKKIFNQILPLFENYKSVILGDREFCSPKLGKWLGEQGLYFCLRQKKNINIKNGEEEFKELNDLGLGRGMKLFLNNIKVSKGNGFGGMNIACKWKRNYKGFSAKQPWYILTNFESLDLAILAYQKRFDIEEMFRDFKKGGYNLEETQVSGKRLTVLIMLIAIAYVTASLEGRIIKQKGIQNYVARVREAKRSHPRHSSFYVGLHAHNWVSLFKNQIEIVQELMRINRNKLPYYVKGLRAMELVQSVL